MSLQVKNIKYLFVSDRRLPLAWRNWPGCFLMK